MAKYVRPGNTLTRNTGSAASRVVAPPAPVSRYIDLPDGEGVLLRWMAPVDGKLSDFIFRLDHLSADRALLSVEVARDASMSGGVQAKFYANASITGTGAVALENSFDVAAGDRLTISVKAVSFSTQNGQTGLLKGLWVSFSLIAKRVKAIESEEVPALDVVPETDPIASLEAPAVETPESTTPEV